MKKVTIVFAVLFFLFSNLVFAFGPKLDPNPDPKNDRVVTTWKGRYGPSKYKYYFYKEGNTIENENRDFQECLIESFREIIDISVYNNGNGSKNGVDPLYCFKKAGYDLGACMESKGYVIKEHQVIPDPDPDFTSEK